MKWLKSETRGKLSSELMDLYKQKFELTGRLLQLDQEIDHLYRVYSVSSEKEFDFTLEHILKNESPDQPIRIDIIKESGDNLQLFDQVFTNPSLLKEQYENSKVLK